MQLVDIIEHKLRINSYWEDYYRFEFYRRELSWEERKLYVGFFGSHYYPWEGNSLKFDRVFQLKSLQKAILTAHGVATPRLVAKAGTQYPINTPEKFRAVMADIDTPVVTKFDGGGSGVGIYCLQPENGDFRCKDQPVDADWVWSQYEPVIHRGFIVEEQAENHPALQTIFPNALNTLRITTVRTADGQWHLLLPYIKFGRSGMQVDNLSAGGLFAGVDDAGRIGTLYSLKSMDEFSRHPDTGAEAEGQTVPFYEEARALALEASNTFGFMATVAWDVGITPTGPVIIEGNPCWEPHGIQDRLGPMLTPQIAAGLMPRSWWTPWDRTHMYPRYMRDADGGWLQKWLARRRKAYEFVTNRR